MKTIAILLALLLSGCSTSNPNLLRGELFVKESKTKQRHVIQKIEIDEDNIYSIQIHFR